MTGAADSVNPSAAVTGQAQIERVVHVALPVFYLPLGEGADDLHMSDASIPKASAGDHGFSAVRAVVGSVPLIGTAATELFNAIFTPPLERRRDEWRRSVAQRLNDLACAGFIRAEELSTNETFISTTMQATAAALKTHQQEKLEALRNAVVNAAMSHTPDESLQQIFIAFVDSFTVWHLRVLDLQHNPAGWFERNGKPRPEYSFTSSVGQLLCDAFPELRGQREFCDLIDAELHAAGLTTGKGLHTMMSGSGALQRRTSEMGAKLLAFIRPAVHT